jgi:hypothetical protein
VLWPALAEKAYTEINEEGWIGHDGTNSFNGAAGAALAGKTNGNGINAGWVYVAIPQITGLATQGGQNLTDVNLIVQAVNAGRMVALSSAASAITVVPDHAYGVVSVSYNKETQQYTFTLYNPWGFIAQPLTWQQIQANFDTWDCSL